MAIQTKQPSIVPANTQSPGSVRKYVGQIQQARDKNLTIISEALSSVQTQLDTYGKFLRSPLPNPEEITILDQNGALIAWIGNREFGGKQYFGAGFESLYVGGDINNPQNANLIASKTGLSLNNATFVLNLNGTTTTIDNHTFGGRFVGIEIQDDTTKDAFYATPDFVELTNGDPALNKPRFNAGNNGTAGIARVFDGTGGGGIAGHGEQHVLDGSNGNYTLQGIINFNGQALSGAANPGAITPPATCAGFLTIEVAGVSYKLAAFLP